MDNKGIYVSKQVQGTKISVQTKNSTYKIEVLDTEGEVRVIGGLFEVSSVARFNGSTFGGTMLKMDWIGKDMHMEFQDDERIYTTSLVREATIFGLGWVYAMGWDG